MAESELITRVYSCISEIMIVDATWASVSNLVHP